VPGPLLRPPGCRPLHEARAEQRAVVPGSALTRRQGSPTAGAEKFEALYEKYESEVKATFLTCLTKGQHHALLSVAWGPSCFQCASSNLPSWFLCLCAFCVCVQGRARKSVPAQKLWFAIMEAQVETGNP